MRCLFLLFLTLLLVGANADCTLFISDTIESVYTSSQMPFKQGSAPRDDIYDESPVYNPITLMDGHFISISNVGAVCADGYDPGSFVRDIRWYACLEDSTIRGYFSFDGSLEGKSSEPIITDTVMATCGAHPCRFELPDAFQRNNPNPDDGPLLAIFNEDESYMLDSIESCKYYDWIFQYKELTSNPVELVCDESQWDGESDIYLYGHVRMKEAPYLPVNDVYTCIEPVRCSITTHHSMTTEVFQTPNNPAEAANHTGAFTIMLYTHDNFTYALKASCHGYFLLEGNSNVTEYSCAGQDQLLCNGIPCVDPFPTCVVPESCSVFLSDDLLEESGTILTTGTPQLNGVCTCPAPYANKGTKTLSGLDRCGCNTPGYRYSHALQECISTCDYYIIDDATNYATPVKSDGQVYTWDVRSCRCNKDGMRYGPTNSDHSVSAPSGLRSRTAAECRCNTADFRLDITTNQCVNKTCELRVYTETTALTIQYVSTNQAKWPQIEQAVVYTSVPPLIQLKHGYSGVLYGYCNPAGGYINAQTTFLCDATSSEVSMPRVCLEYTDPYPCPSVYQFYNGRECECLPDTENVCHTCGVHDSCNGNGYCFSSSIDVSFCSCQDGYSGEYCTIPPVRVCTTRGAKTQCELPYNAQECNCAVSWKDYTTVAAGGQFSVVLHAPLRSSIDQEHMDAIVRETLPTWRRVGNLAQIEYDIAMFDPECDGFTYYTAQDGSGDIIAHPVRKVQATSSQWLKPEWIPGTISSYNIHIIDRFSTYDCLNGDHSLDPSWYYWDSGYRQDIDAIFRKNPNICPYGTTLPCNYNRPVTAINENDVWVKIARQHWRLVGHLKLYAPNAGCTSNPPIWDPSTKCKTATIGCEQVNSVQGLLPCSGNGRCVRSTSALDINPYKCECDKFDSTQVLGGSFANIPRYMGLACQYQSLAFCQYDALSNTTADTYSICRNQPWRCVPTKISDIETTLVSSRGDFKPGCQCESFTNPFTGQSYNPSEYEGEFCEESRCQKRSCRTVDATSTCVPTTVIGSPTTYTCACGPKAAGVFCEFSSANCINPFYPDAGPCTGDGTCVPPSTDSGNANVNATGPWCRCNSQFSGKWCEVTDCLESVLVPGQGVCDTNGVKKYCYPVYGGNICSIKLCEQSGGTTISRTTCGCPFDLGLMSKNGTDPTCWRRCPGNPSDGSVCGSSTYNQCLQSTRDAATCSCSAHNGWVEKLINDPVLGANTKTCELFCGPHGTPAQTCDPTCSADLNKPCVCQPGFTGYKCDLTLCQNGGMWNNVTLKCDCPPGTLYYGNACQNNYCNNPETQVEEGIVLGTRCSCNAPFTNSNQFFLDCSGSVCGSNGKSRTLLPGEPYKESCTCEVAYKTVCKDINSDCDFCSVSHCENGGKPASKTSFRCNCLWPFKSNQDGGFCSYFNCLSRAKDPVTGNCATHDCTANGVPGPGYCTCNNGWESWLNSTHPSSKSVCIKDPCCNVSPCQNGGIWNQLSLACMCPESIFVGRHCDVLAVPVSPTVEPVIPINCGTHGSAAGSVCICRNYWSGVTCEISPCTLPGSSFNDTSVRCNCPARYAGILCEVYLGGESNNDSSNSSSTGSDPEPQPNSCYHLYLTLPRFLVNLIVIHLLLKSVW